MLNLKQQLPNLTENEPLAQYTTFKIGGPARYFFVAQSRDDVIKTMQLAQETKTLFFILGGGSNILISDEGFDGLVIKIQNTKYKIQNTMIEAEAGVSLAKLVVEATNNDLSGFEWAAGIPGTIGGAIRGNVGAYGHSIGELVKSIKVLKLTSNDKKEQNSNTSQYWSLCSITKEECGFGYRTSIFKQNRNLIILEITLQLSHGDKEKSLKQMKELITTRQGKLPQECCAGSVFKNYELKNHAFFLDREKMRGLEKLKNQFSQATDDELNLWLERGKIPAAWLIEQCGLKGKQIGQAQISPKHANTIVNLGGAHAKDIIALIDLIKKKVQDKFNIQLEEEIELVGF